MSDFVDLSQLNPTTWYALEQYAVRHGYDEWLRKFIQPQWAAWLIVLLKVEQDTEELFPSGKWATIQRLEQMVSNAAEMEVKAQTEEVTNG